MNIQKLPGDADKVRVKVGHVFREPLRSIPRGVDTDHDYPGVLFLRQTLQFPDKARQERHGRRAYIGAVGKAEEHQRPVAP